MLDLLAEYDITLENAMTFDTLAKLRAIYEGTVTALVGEKDKAESTDSELKKYLLAVTNMEDDVAKSVKEFRSDVREMFYGLIDENPRTVLALVEVISEIKSEILSERDYWITKVKRESAPTKVIDADYEAKREDAAKLAELIRQLYPILSSLVPTDKRGDEFGPEAFPLEPKKVGGEPVPGQFLPKLSRLPRNDDNPSGRAAIVRHLRFRWNGNEIQDGTLPSDVAHEYVSDFKQGFNIDWTGIRALAKADGVEMFGPEPWRHDFPTGTLEIYDKRPVKETPKEDSPSE